MLHAVHMSRITDTCELTKLQRHKVMIVAFTTFYQADNGTLFRVNVMWSNSSEPKIRDNLKFVLNVYLHVNTTIWLLVSIYTSLDAFLVSTFVIRARISKSFLDWFWRWH